MFISRFIKPVFIILTIIIFYSCKSGPTKDYSFLALPSSQTNVNFKNKLEEKPLFNILYYLYYYNGAGVATGDINNDGLPDIYFAANNPGGNKLYLNKGDFKFEDITEKAGVSGNADWCTGVTMADVNGDGFLDIYVCAVDGKYNLTGHNQLFINNQNGTFTEKSAQYGLDFSGLSTQSAFFDYDHDGDLDCFILNQSHHPHSNISDTSFRRKYDPASGDRLYQNDISTTGKFTDVSAAAGIYQSSLGYGLGLAIADFNNDGWDDVYVGNDFHENDYYYLNNGNGSFTESGAQHFGHYSRFSMGNDAADYNNDGQMDIITVDMLPPDEKTLKTYGSDENADIYKIKIKNKGYQDQYSKNSLQRNNGNGVSFSETSLLSGISATDWSWSPLIADFDNDGYKDIFISSGIVKRPVDLDYVRFISDLNENKGRQQTDAYDDVAIKNMPDGSSHPYFFKGNGGLQFKDVSNDWGTGDMKGYFTGASYADLNNDGKLDVIINCINSPAVILKNNTPDKREITVVLKGEGANTFGIGAKVWVINNGKMQYQQLSLTRGFQSSSEPRLHFGLDSTRYIDSILVVWPSQKYQLFRNTPAIPKLEVKETQASKGFEYDKFFPPAKKELEDVSQTTNYNWVHRENNFFDYNIQYLIPHQLSTRGPKLAVADVNKDGLDDFYACGASGQSSSLMIQTKAGGFLSADTALFNKSIQNEKVAALFFDANNDSWPDLYVVSGGNELKDGSPDLADHLYMNDGRGHYTESVNAIPALLKNKSCVNTADIDKDGDLDLFVGGLADALKYGVAQPSYLLINDSKGNFAPAPKSTIHLDSVGMVTTSSFTDINNDGWPDLVVTGEWMPLKIYINNKGTFSEKTIAGSTGLWQSLYTADVNGDGFQDILAGNWGHNTKLYAGKNGPLKLYVKDFDKNGSIEQLMCYTIDGKEYPFLAKDELERPLPVLKKAYLTYSEVAGKTVQYMLYDLFKDYTELKAETLSSSCFLNDGKGNFTRIDLPEELQLAPVMAFTQMEEPGTFMAAGNFYGVIPYEGRYDALSPTVFEFNKNLNRFSLDYTVPFIHGEARDLKWLQVTGNKKLLVIANNNDKLNFLKVMGE
jgi:hypothetical protein